MGALVLYLGETLSLLTAINWAFAVILFRKSGESVHPIGLNLFKNILAVTLILPTMWITGDTLMRDVPARDYALLLASGAIGIGLADTLFLKSLNALGAGLLAIVDCCYSPFIILLSIAFLGESLALLQIIGVVLIVTAVLTALNERKSHGSDGRKIVMGIVWGVLAMAANAVGIVMIKPLLEQSPLLWTTEIRLMGGVIVLVAVLLLRTDRRKIWATVISSNRWGYTVSGSFMGAYVSMLLWLAGMKYTQASVASALNQTSNVFIFIFAWLFLRENMDRYKILGIVLGVIGAFLVTIG